MHDWPCIQLFYKADKYEMNLRLIPYESGIILISQSLCMMSCLYEINTCKV